MADSARDHRMTQEETTITKERLDTLGIGNCMSRLTWPQKRQLFDLTANEFEKLTNAKVFNVKYPPIKNAERLNKILSGWVNGPASVEARIDDMANKVFLGKTQGRETLKKGESNKTAREEYRTDWVAKRRRHLRETYGFERTDEVQLNTLCSVEYKLKELTADVSKLGNAANLEKMRTLVELQTALLKGLGISRQDREKKKTEEKKKDSWESLVRSFDDNRTKRYADSKDLYEKDLEKLRLTDARAKLELEEMGYYGDD